MQLGPVQPPPISRYQEAKAKRPVQEDKEEEENAENEADEEELSSGSEELDYEDDEDEDMEDADAAGESSSEDEGEASEQSESDNEAVLAKVRETVLNGEQDQPNKKRKRAKEDELEDVYMRKLAREELKEEEKRKKKQKTETADADGDEKATSDDSDDEEFTIPKHETQMESSTNTDEIEKATRTVFLGNVSSEAITSKKAKKTLLRHLASFIPDLADNNPPHKVESLRFRSTAFATVLPKKAAFAKKEILDATTKSTNAYAVYSTQVAAREAAKRLNGTIVLNRHLRVDSLAHPAKTDHRRCVFVGNLGFVDDESTVKTDDDEKKKKTRPPGDVEEGLWVHFSKAGKVESVRVVRDAKTRVGKGIAYVQFADENGVEAALQFNEQKFPPLLPRKLRVVRAKAPKKKDKKPLPSQAAKFSKSKRGDKAGVYNPKATEEQKTQQGRAKAMLGKAGAFKTAESFVFEGHRASAKQGTSGLKLGGKRKGKGKPSNRSTKRAAAWKDKGGKAQFKKKD
jgi:nucleolar protein 12